MVICLLKVRLIQVTSCWSESLVIHKTCQKHPQKLEENCLLLRSLFLRLIKSLAPSLSSHQILSCWEVFQPGFISGRSTTVSVIHRAKVLHTHRLFLLSLSCIIARAGANKSPVGEKFVFACIEGGMAPTVFQEGYDWRVFLGIEVHRSGSLPSHSKTELVKFSPSSSRL